jgi:beta-glucosidase
MNEPSVFAIGPYLEGYMRPFETSLEGGLLAAHITLLCHFRTVRLYREMGLSGKIGAVIAIVPTYPKTPTEKDILAAKIQMDRVCGWWLDPILTGKYPETILRECPDYLNAMPDGFAEELEREYSPVDMIGLNYYYPAFVEYREDLPERSTHMENFYAQEGQLFQLYPAGLYDAMMYMTRKYDRPDIYIAENGLGVLYDGDKEKEINDENRISYLREHLRMVVRSIEAGADIRGYYYWSNFDMFEGSAGYGYRFGLNFTDYETGERTRKKSWHYYKKIIESGCVD